MAQRLKACLICGQPIDVDQKAVPYKGRYAHERCFNNIMKITVQEKQEKLNEATKKRKAKKTEKSVSTKIIQEYRTEEEFQEQKRFFDLLQQVTGIEKLPAKIYKVAEDYVKKYGFSYKGMENTIRYFVFVQENNIEGDGIGIIPYIYDEAQEYYFNNEAVNEQNENILKRGDKLYRTRVIKIKPNYDSTSQLIDMDNFWGDANAD